MAHRRRIFKDREPKMGNDLIRKTFTNNYQKIVEVEFRVQVLEPLVGRVGQLELKIQELEKQLDEFDKRI